MKETALNIATKHLLKTNPDNWNGEGDRPESFKSTIATYPVNDDTELDISFEYDKEDGWYHLCELRDKESEELLAILSGYGVDSPQNLADTISDICQNC